MSLLGVSVVERRCAHNADDMLCAFHVQYIFAQAHAMGKGHEGSKKSESGKGGSGSWNRGEKKGPGLKCVRLARWKSIGKTLMKSLDETLANFHDEWAVRQVDNMQWAQGLPNVVIKDEYKTLVCPNPFGYIKFPVKRKGNDVAPREFISYLINCKNIDAESELLLRINRGVCRVFDMIIVDGRPVTESVAMDPRVLESIFVNGIHKELFNLGVLKPAYSWTRRIIEAFKEFVMFQQGKSAKCVIGKSDPTLKYSVQARSVVRRLHDEAESAKEKADADETDATTPGRHRGRVNTVF